jgi:hypothetical protein
MDFAFCKAKGSQTARDAAVEMWPSILEKAYAKLFNTDNNGWEQLEGGLCSLGMADLTGMASLNFRHSADSERVISGRLWKDLVRMHRMGFFIGASSAGESDTKKSAGNIVERHAFSILDVQEVSKVCLCILVGQVTPCSSDLRHAHYYALHTDKHRSTASSSCSCATPGGALSGLAIGATRVQCGISTLRSKRPSISRYPNYTCAESCVCLSRVYI